MINWKYLRTGSLVPLNILFVGVEDDATKCYGIWFLSKWLLLFPVVHNLFFFVLSRYCHLSLSFLKGKCSFVPLEWNRQFDVWTPELLSCSNACLSDYLSGVGAWILPVTVSLWWLHSCLLTVYISTFIFCIVDVCLAFYCISKLTSARLKKSATHETE